METVKIDNTTINFCFNEKVVAVALLQAEEYYLYFNAGGYEARVLQMCLDSLNTLNSNLTGETNE